MRLAIIPARSGSTRIKNKNVKELCGKPLLIYSLETAHSSDLFDEVHVSTDSTEYVSIIEKYGYQVDFLRESRLAGNRSSIVEILRWVIKEYEKQGKYFDEVCMLMATAPLIESDDLKKGHELFVKHKRLIPVLSVASFAAPVERGFKVRKDGILEPMFEEKREMHSQDFETSYHDAGAFFFIKTEQLMKGSDKVINNFLPYILPRYKVVDIDELEDFHTAEILYLGRKAIRE